MKTAKFYIGDKSAILAKQDERWYLVQLCGAFNLEGIYTHTIKLVMKLSEMTDKLNAMAESGELQPVFLMEMNNYGIVAMNDTACYKTYSELVTGEYEFANALMRGDIVQDDS